MERTFLTFSIPNMITIGLMSGVAYLGVVGAQILVKKVSNGSSKTATPAATS